MCTKRKDKCYLEANSSFFDKFLFSWQGIASKMYLMQGQWMIETKKMYLNQCLRWIKNKKPNGNLWWNTSYSRRTYMRYREQCLRDILSKVIRNKLIILVQLHFVLEELQFVTWEKTRSNILHWCSIESKTRMITTRILLMS